MSKIEFYSENNIEIVDFYTFRECCLTEFEIGPNLREISAVSFEGHKTTLERFTMNGANEIFTVYEKALYNGTRLVCYPNAVKYPQILPTCTSFGSECFMGSALVDCTFLPNSLRILGPIIFRNCLNLQRAVIPYNVSSISSDCFYNCPKLISIVLPGLAEIPNNFVNLCKSLTYVIIPDTVTRINAKAFVGCPSLVYLSVPDSVTYIDKNAFLNSSIYSCGISCSEEEKEILIQNTHLTESSFEVCKSNRTKQTCGRRFAISPYILISIIKF